MRGLIIAMLIGLYGHDAELSGCDAGTCSKPTATLKEVIREPVLTVNIFISDLPGPIDRRFFFSEKPVKFRIPTSLWEGVNVREKRALRQDLFRGERVRVYSNLIFQFDAGDSKFCPPSQIIGWSLPAIFYVQD